MTIEKRIENIKTGLLRLSEKNKPYEIFGPTGNYQPTQVHEKEIQEFESKIGISLPFEFREFLLKIGYGVGPENGLFNLKEMTDTYEIWRKCLNDKGEYNLEFELNNNDAKDLIEKKKANGKDYYYKRLKSVDGILPISTEGCTYFSYIVLKGEQKGKVWSIDINEFDTLPSGVTEELDFLTLIEKWLE